MRPGESGFSTAAPEGLGAFGAFSFFGGLEDDVVVVVVVFDVEAPVLATPAVDAAAAPMTAAVSFGASESLSVAASAAAAACAAAFSFFFRSFSAFASMGLMMLLTSVTSMSALSSFDSCRPKTGAF